MTLLKSTFIYIFMLLTFTVAKNATAATLSNEYRIQKLIINEATRQNLNPALALAIAKVESNFNPNALSHAGAKGVMQIMPKTAEQEFGVSRYRLYDAQTNVRLGIRFIKQLLHTYGQRIDIALSHYNGGSAVKDKYGNLSVIPATKKYVKKVLAAKLKFDHLATTPTNNSFLEVNNNNFREKEIGPPNSLINNLQQLRLHNVTRGLNKPLIKSNFYLSNASPKNLQTKKQKVLVWESVFD
ncbi:MAG: lytic transglycosylase domain-containing protein [Reichenbachiella sp.]